MELKVHLMWPRLTSTLKKDRALALIVLSIEPSLLYIVGDSDNPITVWKKLADHVSEKDMGQPTGVEAQTVLLAFKGGSIRSGTYQSEDVCNDEKKFAQFQRLKQPEQVTLGDGQVLEATGQGIVSLKMKLPGNKTSCMTCCMWQRISCVYLRQLKLERLQNLMTLDAR